MSTTLHLLCRTCKKAIWVGQGSRLYDASANTEALFDFLTAHHTSFRYGGREHVLCYTDHHGTDDLIDTGEWLDYTEGGGPDGHFFRTPKFFTRKAEGE